MDDIADLVAATVQVCDGSSGQGKLGKNQRIRENQGIQKYQGAKVNKDAEKNFELLYADCVQQFKIFSCLFLLQLFVPPVLNLFCHSCF